MIITVLPAAGSENCQKSRYVAVKLAKYNRSSRLIIFLISPINVSRLFITFKVDLKSRLQFLNLHFFYLSNSPILSMWENILADIIKTERKTFVGCFNVF